MSASDRVIVEGLRVDCIVGVRPEERVREQALLVDLAFVLDTRTAGRSGRIADTVDYDRVCEEVAVLLRFRNYQLLEMAAEEVAAMLYGLHDDITRLELSLRKPQALTGRARAARVSIEREPGDYRRGNETTSFGEVEILYESSQAGLYLLHVEPGREIPAHFHDIMRELEWLVCGDLERDGRLLRGFEPVEWPRHTVHRYRNVGSTRATLFCCDMPPFVPADEVRVDGDPA